MFYQLFCYTQTFLNSHRTQQWGKIAPYATDTGFLYAFQHANTEEKYALYDVFTQHIIPSAINNPAAFDTVKAFLAIKDFANGMVLYPRMNELLGARYRWDFLLACAVENNIELAKILIKAGVSTEVLKNHIRGAASTGDYQFIINSLKSGVRIPIKNKQLQLSLLNHAVQQNNWQDVQQIGIAYAEVYNQALYCATHAAIRGNHNATVAVNTLLDEAPTNNPIRPFMYYGGEDRKTPLLLVIENGNIQLIQKFLAKFPNILAETIVSPEYGPVTPLQYAVKLHKRDVVSIIIDHVTNNADHQQPDIFNILDKETSQELLQLAVANQKWDFVKLLAEHITITDRTYIFGNALLDVTKDGVTDRNRDAVVALLKASASMIINSNPTGELWKRAEELIRALPQNLTDGPELKGIVQCLVKQATDAGNAHIAFFNGKREPAQFADGIELSVFPSNSP